MKELTILGDLISFDTSQDKENSKIVNYLEEYLTSLGFSCQRLTKEEKSCLVATIGKTQNLAFFCHTDTVEASSSWTKNIFELTEEKDDLYGLGVCDMKGGIAALLTALSKVSFKEKGVMLCFTYDEEIDFTGIREFVKSEKRVPQRVVFTEPTDNIPVLGNKGCIGVKAVMKGKAAHSSTPNLGVNALSLLLSFLRNVESYSKTLEEKQNDLFSIPYATYNLASIHGGKEVNKVPDYAEATFEFRTISKEQNEKIINTLRAISSIYPMELSIFTPVPAAISKDLSFQNYIENLTGKKAVAFNYTTEASFLPDIDVLILGPGPVTAHQANERISKKSFYETISLYQKLIEDAIRE